MTAIVSKIYSTVGSSEEVVGLSHIQPNYDYGSDVTDAFSGSAHICTATHAARKASTKIRQT